jgi:hypothetical protein
LIVTAVNLGGCNKNCGCLNPGYGYFDIYYKSNSNPDLLNPQTGTYYPSEVKVDEMVKQVRGISPIPAPTSPEGQYVWDYGIHDGIYFIHYNCSLIKYGNDLTMTLIQLKPGITDTLTFTYPQSGNAYPTEVFYNRKLVWTYKNNREFTIIK